MSEIKGKKINYANKDAFYICDFCTESDDGFKVYEESELAFFSQGVAVCEDCYENIDEDTKNGIEFGDLPKFRSPQTLEIKRLTDIAWRNMHDLEYTERMLTICQDKLKWRPLSQITEDMSVILVKNEDRPQGPNIYTKDASTDLWRRRGGIDFLGTNADDVFIEMP